MIGIDRAASWHYLPARALCSGLSPMTDTYNNVPMSESAARSVEKQDGFWDGPRLIVLSFATLGAAFVLLWLCAEGTIGPTVNEASWGGETHLLQGNLEPRPFD